jgi:SAM-dependent methyltransferase
MNITARIMENTHFYRLWQTPFAEKKFAPVLANNDLQEVRRVLDVGCGPGTNARYFAHTDYVGLDRNVGCIEYARKHYRGNFIVADATKYRVDPDQRFDFILVNSFLHHIDTSNAASILSHLGTLLTDDGHVHILDLVLPERWSIPRALARLDRGDFPRPLQDWLEIVSGVFEPAVLQSYKLGWFGVALWDMVYFKGRTRT